MVRVKVRVQNKRSGERLQAFIFVHIEHKRNEARRGEVSRPAQYEKGRKELLPGPLHLALTKFIVDKI
tara:strand:+ start:173 stop:376 length:204 start_codon:yes stop_codon:yes gene_type:complete